MLLLLRRDEIADLISSLSTRSGKVDKMFYFSFNEPDRVVLTRGAREHRDVSSFTFAARLPLLKEYLVAG
jgi:hypothetical protein